LELYSQFLNNLIKLIPKETMDPIFSLLHLFNASIAPIAVGLFPPKEPKIY
jgi:hypothetical protein